MACWRGPHHMTSERDLRRRTSPRCKVHAAGSFASWIRRRRKGTFAILPMTSCSTLTPARPRAVTTFVTNALATKRLRAEFELHDVAPKVVAQRKLRVRLRWRRHCLRRVSGMDSVERSTAALPEVSYRRTTTLPIASCAPWRVAR